MKGVSRDTDRQGLRKVEKVGGGLSEAKNLDHALGKIQVSSGLERLLWLQEPGEDTLPLQE